MSQFKNRVFGAPVDPKIIEEFNRLAGGQDRLALEPIGAPKFKNYLGDRVPFVRMWCAVNINDSIKSPEEIGDTKNKYQKIERKDGEYIYYSVDDVDKANPISVGSDDGSKTLIFTVNENRENSYDVNPLESVGSGVSYVSQLSDQFGGGNPFLKPAAGITSMTTKTQGSLGALQHTSVDFSVSNRHDFENIFLPYFLRPGAKVVVDFGWSEKDMKLYDPEAQVRNSDLDFSDFEKFLYDEKTGFITKFHGRMNTAIGNVIKYDSNVTENGNFMCNLEIVSSNTGLIDKEISDDNNIRFMFSNSIDDVLVNVLAASVGLDTFSSIHQISYSQKAVDPIDTNDVTKDFFNGLNLSTDSGQITDFASKVGVFYQDLAPFMGTSTEKADVFEEKEKVYISYGKFEDVFLNNMIAGVQLKKYDSKGEPINLFLQEPTKDHTNVFDTRTSYVRWSEDLFQIQNAPISKNESLPSFILPGKWDDSYNAITLGESGKEDGKDVEYGKFRGTSEEDRAGLNPKYPGIPVIPLRDVFISVPLIKQAFSSKANVNDALTFIFDRLTSDSNLVWNIKMKPTTNAKGGITFHDANLMPQIPEDEMLIFDVTSGETIVKACDLNFSTPKAGLSSMIAISNLNSPQPFDQQELSMLNNLNLLKAGRENVRIRSLPLQGDINDTITNPTMNIDFSVLQPNQSFDYTDTVSRNLAHKYAVYKSKVRELNKEKREAAKDDGGREEPKQSDVNKDRPNTEYAKSVRDALQKKVRNETYNAKGPATISPILPVELSLTVLGNSYLEIGDYFNVNYLPSHYKDRVYFQVIGIEDKFSPESWETSYTTVMRIKPSKKSDYSKPSKNILIPTKLLPLPKQGDSKTRTLQTEKSLGVEASSMKMIKAGVHESLSGGMNFQMAYEMIKSTDELKKPPTDKKTLGRINFQVSKLSATNSPHDSLAGNKINLAFGYAVQENLLQDTFLKNIGGNVHGEIEASSGDWKNGTAGNKGDIRVVVSYGDLNMGDIIDDFESGADYGLSKTESRLATRLYSMIADTADGGRVRRGGLGSLSEINKNTIPGGSITQKGLHWTDDTIGVEYMIPRVPTAIRFLEEGKNSLEDPDNPERILILTLKTDEIGVFPILKIPKWIMDANGMTPKQLCENIFKKYELFYGAINSFNYN